MLKDLSETGSVTVNDNAMDALGSVNDSDSRYKLAIKNNMDKLNMSGGYKFF